jgi:hypothetical protein
MQTIFPTSLTPPQYVEQNYQKQVPAPENCPNCAHAHTLEALAYYHRYVTWLTDVLIIWVRRFLCRHCRVSVSCLPDFAQPYRAIKTATIAAGFNGQTQSRAVQHWATAIKPYWRRFQTQLPTLLRQVGNAFGPVPLAPTAPGFWQQLLGHCGDLARATRQLVHQFHTCLFGTYRCHQRRPLQAGSGSPARADGAG